jgi:hypothetical protein
MSEPSPPRFKAIAFDYFVIFNPNSVIPAVEETHPGKGAEFTRAWRAKQFEYSFLRSVTNRHADWESNRIARRTPWKSCWNWSWAGPEQVGGCRPSRG